MIKNVEIKNYRSCLNTSFDLHPELSVLIGPNSSGKTNILNALLILKKLTSEHHRPRVDTADSTSQSELKITFDVEGKKAIFTVIADLYTDENNDDDIVSSKEDWYLKDFTGNRKRIKTPLWFIRELLSKEQGVHLYRYANYFRRDRNVNPQLLTLPSSTREPLSMIAEELSQIRYYSATQFTNPSKCPVSFEVEKEGTYKRFYSDTIHTRFLRNLYNCRNSDISSYNQFFDIIGPNGIGLIDNIEFKEMLTSSIEYSVRSGGKVLQKKKEKILVIPQFHIGKNALSPNQLSEGTFKTITLLFYLTTETSKILMIEEPEVCVHHGLLSSIIELIKIYSRSRQILISTHSDFLLDEVQPENVYKVINTPENGTTISHITKSMSSSELKALHEYLQKEGNLGEYWRHGGIEG